MEKIESPIIEQRYPHVYKMINCTWGSSDFYDYIDQITIQSRDEPRHGFPFEVFKELNQLVKLHNEVFPNIKHKHDVPFTFAYKL